MIDVFESTARLRPDQVYATFVDAVGDEVSYTYREARLAAAALAQRMRAEGVRQGDVVVVDLPNCPEYALLFLAAGYGSFSLATLNHRLSEAEKTARLLELERGGLTVSLTVNEANIGRLLRRVRAVFGSESEVVASVRGATRRTHSIMGARQDAVDDTVHFAEREAHLFDAGTRAVVMFTSGTTGKAKIVPLTWRKLVESAEASNEALPAAGSSIWQAVLPFYHIGGLQVLVRAVAGRGSVRVYRKFDPELVLREAKMCHATHISVVDKMLQDMLAVSRGRLKRYRCILLGGGPVNQQTLDRALAEGARIFASYGMTETSSQIANRLVEAGFDGGLALLPGYFARIVDPGADGFGRLAVRGPGVFGGYLNARAAFTVDGFFLTGDTAALRGGLLYLKERTSDMFISGGENIYPAEIASVLRRVRGVSDAHVFGISHKVWGRRPAAVVERSDGSLTAEDVYQAVSGRLSKLNLPERIMVVDRLPRGGIGKIDRAATEGVFARRLEASRLTLHRIRLPFRTPFKTAQQTLSHRDAVIVELEDHAGRVGLGECSSFETDWYVPETLPEDVAYLREVLAPLVVGRVFAHPREVAAVFSAAPGAGRHPMAISAVEMAFWDLLGQVEGRPFWRLANEEYERIKADEGLAEAMPALPRAASVKGDRAVVSTGVVVGMGSAAHALEAVRAAASAGYRRVKMKVAPGEGLAAARMVRKEFPHMLVTLDANRSFGERDVRELRALDETGVGWIEEPLAPRTTRFRSCADVLSRLAVLQRAMATPLCVDESYFGFAEAEQILRYRELRCIAVKVAKLGGVEATLRFIVHAQAADREVWMSGMYDTGISRRMHAAFETLPGVVVPGDVGSPLRYFDVDVADPPYADHRGYVTLNDEGREAGFGCALNRDALARVLVHREMISS